MQSPAYHRAMVPPDNRWGTAGRPPIKIPPTGDIDSGDVCGPQAKGRLTLVEMVSCPNGGDAQQPLSDLKASLKPGRMVSVV